MGVLILAFTVLKLTVTFSHAKLLNRFFEVGLNDVLMHSQCITFSRQQSERSQTGEAERSPGMECTAMDRAV